MSTTEPWQIAEVAGPKKAMVIGKPEVAVALIKKAAHPLLVVGHYAEERELEGKKID
jgi:acetyl-CoA decarbonylase/synthase complex subunit epsilon